MFTFCCAKCSPVVLSDQNYDAVSFFYTHPFRKCVDVCASTPTLLAHLLSDNLHFYGSVRVVASSSHQEKIFRKSSTLTGECVRVRRKSEENIFCQQPVKQQLVFFEGFFSLVVTVCRIFTCKIVGKPLEMVEIGCASVLSL